MFEGLLRPQPKKLQVPRVNLFPEDPFYDTIFGKGLRWAVSAGRHIVIFTEIVVIGSFFTRFVLDRQVTDLNTAILQKQSIAESYGTLDADIRAIQAKTKDVKNILSQQGRYQVLSVLSTLTPPEVSYDQISLNADRLTLQGVAQSSRSLSVLIEGLRANPDFSNISLGGIKSGESGSAATSFSLTMSYSKGVLEETKAVTTVRSVGSPAPASAPAAGGGE